MLSRQDLSCCLVKHFNISGIEFVAGSICEKTTRSGRLGFRVPRGEGVGDPTYGVGIYSVISYNQIVFTKVWSSVSTRVYSGHGVTWLDIQFNRSVAIDVI